MCICNEAKSKKIIVNKQPLKKYVQLAAEYAVMAELMRKIYWAIRPEENLFGIDIECTDWAITCSRFNIDVKGRTGNTWVGLDGIESDYPEYLPPKFIIIVDVHCTPYNFYVYTLEEARQASKEYYKERIRLDKSKNWNYGLYPDEKHLNRFDKLPGSKERKVK